MLKVSKDTSKPKKKTKTARRISLLTLLILTFQVGNNPSTRTRPVKKTRTIKEVSAGVEDKNMVVGMTTLPQVSISFLKRKKKISLRSNSSTARRKVIMSPNILKKSIQKLVLVLMISRPVTAARKKALGTKKISKNGENMKNENL